MHRVTSGTSLLIFEGESPELYNWLATQMQNYLLYLVHTKDWRPNFYDLIDGGHDLMGHHVVHFIGCQAAQMLQGFSSVHDTWDTREPLNAVGTAKEAL